MASKQELWHKGKPCYPLQSVDRQFTGLIFPLPLPVTAASPNQHQIMTRTLLTCIALVAFAASAMAQTNESAAVPDPGVPQGENMKVPEGWKLRLDKPSDEVKLVSEEDPSHSNIFFVNMTPGWHITTGPAAILYHPALKATGDFRAKATLHLFPPGERNEAYGLFIGGQGLEGGEQSYLYFVLRKTGEYLVKRRDGSETSVVKNWTAHPSIVPSTAETSGSVKNDIAVEAHSETIRFFVNGELVAETDREGMPADGVVGLRVNHHLNLHVSDLSVSPLD